MSKLTEELERAIQKAALDGALTKDAVSQFHSIVKQNEGLEDKVESLTEKVEEVKKERNNLTEQYTEMHSRVGEFNKRISDLEEREKKMTELELKAEFQGERVKDHKEMFTTVFRNSVIRKEVMTPTHPSAPDQYGTRQEGYPSKDIVEEEEK